MSEFNSNPNQRKIAITGKEKCDNDNLYAKINIYALIQAMNNLTPTTFQMWVFLAKNRKGHEFWLSPQAVANETGMKKSSIQESVRQLIDQGYLVKRYEASSIYDFYEIPKPPEEEGIKIHING